MCAQSTVARRSRQPPTGFLSLSWARHYFYTENHAVCGAPGRGGAARAGRGVVAHARRRCARFAFVGARGGCVGGGLDRRERLHVQAGPQGQNDLLHRVCGGRLKQEPDDHWQVPQVDCSQTLEHRLTGLGLS